ncbi:MAG: tetratricopeptide repeat protein [Treponema sp.]|jgi:tetratricopeptide (TPR) repeat protein|nr:tetratricopeptide repeat protein [Treponema sp.]
MLDSDQKKIFIIGGCALVLIAGVLFFLFLRNPSDPQRDNTLLLAREYIDRGEYQRAMDLVDGILIKNPNDEDARRLRDEALEGKRLAELRRSDGSPLTAEDIARLLAEFRGGAGTLSLSDVERILAMRDAAANRGGAPLAPADAAETADASGAEAEARAAADAAEARKRAEAEELAKASAAVQAQMREVNELVSRGRAAIERSDFAAASQAFDEAAAKMPKGETRFEAQKLADISDAWYGGFAKNPGSAQGNEAARNAVQAAQQAAQKDPVLALPHFTLGRINRDRGSFPNAVSEFREASKLDPNNYLYSYELGRSQFRTAAYEDARHSFEASTKLNAKFEPAWYNLGGTFGALRRPNDALAAYQKAVALKGDYSAAHREIGRIYSAQNNYPKAVESFARALQGNPKDTASLRDLGYAQNQNGQNQAAEASFTQALAADPSDAQTNDNMALVKIALNKFNEAVEYAKKATQAAPANERYLYTLGLACEKAGDIDAAISAYKSSAEKNARYVRPRVNLSLIYLENGFNSEALTCLLEAVRAEPNSFEVNNNLGNVYARMDDWPQAIQYYEAALRVQGGNVTVRMNLARAYAGAQNMDRARDSYLEVVRLSPNNYDALFELGKTCVSMGDRESAKKYLASLLEKSPSYSGRAEAEKILNGL